MKKTMQRVISTVLSIAMLISLLPTAVFADDTPSRVIYGSYDAEGNWVQDSGSGSGTITTENGITLSKIAVPDPKDLNKYTITLTVETSTTTTTVNPTSAATVLVIDVSGSMDYCAECGGEEIETFFGSYLSGGHESDCPHYNSDWRQNDIAAAQNRMTAAINAALGFVDSYAGETANVGRWLAVVKFSTNASTVLDWVDISGGVGNTGYDSAVNAINNLSAGGGTNLDDGLYTANGLMESEVVDSVPTANKNVIALTDGIPTYYNDPEDDGLFGDGLGGNGFNGSATINNATAATAATLRNNASVYTVCFGVANEVCYDDGPTVGEFLEEDIATPAGTDEEGNTITYAYNADNSDELNAAFEAITDSITEGISGEGFAVTDPMSSSVTLNPHETLPESIVITDNTINWSLGEPETRTEGDTTYYAYTFSYNVEVNSSAEGFVDGAYYPANGNAYLEIPAEDGGEPDRIYFPVPAVTGVAPTYTVIYDEGDHGTLAGADANGQVVHEDIRIHSATPEAPAVTPDEKYYFTGWSPAVEATVTGDVTYVAQYASQIEIYITANSDDVTYSGSERTVSGYTVAGLPEGYVLSGVEAEVSGTDAGTYENLVTGDTPVITYNGEDVTHMFIINRIPGELIINPKAVTLTSATDTKEYDGTPLTNQNVTAVGFVEGEGATYEVTGSQLIVGTSPNEFTYTLNEGTKAENYSITEVVGQLNVTNRTSKYEVSVTANSGTYTYDGTAKEVTGFESLTVSPNGQTYTVSGLTASGSGTNANTYTVSVEGTAIVTDAYGNDVTDQFTVNAIPGTLVINKRAVTLTSASGEREYNGEPLTAQSVEVTEGSWADGEGATYTVTGTRTLVGTSPNTFSYTLNEGTLAGNYDITTIEGSLNVTDRNTKYAITVEANSGEFKYDGTEHKVEGFKTLTFEVDGNTYTVEGLTASAVRTDAGTTTVTITGVAQVLDENKENVTAQFAVSTENGQLTVTKRSVTLISGSSEKAYDGKALTNSKVEVTGDGFVEGEGASYPVTGSQTLVGESENAFTYTLNEGTKADNYEITTEYGKLVVTDREKQFEITVTANSGEYTYDGKEKTTEGFTKELVYDFDGVKFTVEGLSASVTAVNAGTYTNEIIGTPLVKDADGNDVTAQFIVKTVDGQLIINKRNVTLTSATASKEYDGTPLTNDEVTVTGDGWAEGEGADYDVTGSQLVAGSTSNSFTYELLENTKAENYSITKVPGTLTVTDREAKYEITVVANSKTKKYTGEEFNVNGFETLTFKVEGNTYTVEGLTAEAYGTDAGTYPSEVNGTAVVRDAALNDVTAQFAVKSTNGALTITKREVTLTSATDEKEYDGTALTNDKVTVTGDGWANGEGAVYTVTGSQTLVGSSENTFTYTLNEDTTADNYSISTANGTLTVKNRDTKYAITVVANSGSKMYDGEALAVEGFETLTFEVEGNTYTVSGLTAENTQIDAGEYVVNVTGTPVVKDAKGNDVTAQFAVSTVNGELIITKRAVTMTSATDSKEYDGTPLTNDTVSVTGDGFVEGEGASYTVTGSQTLTGSSDNTFIYALNEGTKAENYEIETKFGTLTIGDRTEKYEITVEANSGNKMYDGEPMTVSGFKTLEFTVNGVEFTVEGLTASVSATDAGTYKNEITGTAVVKDAAGNDVTAQFIVNTVNGELIITKRNVTLTSVSDTKPYDGTPLTNDEVIINSNRFAEGEGAEFDVTGSQRVVGSSENTFTYTLNDGTNADNYIITVNFGTLTVTNPDALYEVEVIAVSYEDKYDGTSKTAEGIITEDVEGNTFWLNGEEFTLTDLSASRTETNAGEYVVNVTGEATVMDAYGNNVSDVFSITTHPGTLTINKRVVTLTSATDEKEYDGTPLTNDEVTVTGDDWADGEGATYDVTGTQTLVGSSENFFTYTLNAGTSADNYTINTVNGTLTVINRKAPYKIEVVANSGEYLYDGDEKTVEGFKTLEFTVKENGFTYYVSGLTAETTETDAGVYPVNVTGTPVVKDADGNDVTSQFAVSTKAGELIINKRAVTLTSATESKEYDGTALTNDTVTVSGDGFVGKEGATYFVTGTRTLPGEATNTFTYVLGEGTKAENYEIEKVEGTLTITDRDDPFDITVEAKSGKFLYDGEEKVVEGFKTLEFIVNGLTYTVEGIEAYAEETDAGRYTVEIIGEPVVLDEDGNDVTGQFDLNLIDGTLVIEKRLVVITSGSDSKYADGKPLTNDEITETGDGWADGEGADYDVTGTRTLPGVSANTFTYELWDNTEASNYEIEVYFGELEVKETVIIPRPPMKGDVILNKVDSADPTTVLAGAQFALYRAYAFNNDHDDEYVGEYTTNKYGIIEIEDLDPGRYFFVETRAPEGYKLDDTKHHFSITIGKITTVTVDNMKAEVPVVFGTDHYAYVIGYPDGGVHPEATITRAEVATIFFRLLSDEVRGAFMTDENAFSDVNDGDWFNRAVSTMAAIGVVNGYPDGTFRPNGKITRAEFAAIAARFDENGDTTEADFSDIEGHWAVDEISIAANNGWILGYTDNTFQPNKYITRAEAMTLVNRVLQRIVEDEDDLHEDMVTWYDNADTSKWYYLAVQEATNSHYYFRKLNGFETWIDIREVRDWTELEG